jgi:polyisoprenoid-binding protein YceI
MFSRSRRYPARWAIRSKAARGNTRIGLEGSLVVNRKDWGINFNAVLEAGE